MSGVTLVMSHRQPWYFHIRAHDLGKGDEPLVYAPLVCGALLSASVQIKSYHCC